MKLNFIALLTLIFLFFIFVYYMLVPGLDEIFKENPHWYVILIPIIFFALFLGIVAVTRNISLRISFRSMRSNGFKAHILTIGFFFGIISGAVLGLLIFLCKILFGKGSESDFVLSIFIGFCTGLTLMSVYAFITYMSTRYLPRR